MPAFFLMLTIVVAFLGLAIAVIWVNRHLERKRTEAMRRAAKELHLRFHAQGDECTLASLSGFHLFSQGDARHITNLMQGEANDMEVQIFEYQYTTGGGRSSHTSMQTVICFRSPKLDLPEFSLRPENLLHKIGSLFGYQDIDFDTHPDFSKHYLLRGNNEKAIRRRFNEGVLTHFDEHRGLCTEGRGHQLIFYRAAQQVKPKDIRYFMEEGFKVVQLFMK
jgi:hypothetical protein